VCLHRQVPEQGTKEPKVNKRSCALAAAVVLIVLPLGGCRGDGPDGAGARTAGPSPTAAAPATPADNGISTRPAGEIVAAASRALRSARSVQVELDYRDKDGPIRMRLRLTRDKQAAGWIEQAGIRVDLVASGGRFYLRSPRLWEQANPELARLIDDRWVLVPPVAVGELTPFAEDLTIAGLADMVFDPGSTPRFLAKRRSTVAGRHAVRLQAVDGSYFIAATGKPYPLLVDGVGDHQDIAFSRYDQVPPIRAPRGALNLEQLRG
jgi:hypothetical protein